MSEDRVDVSGGGEAGGVGGVGGTTGNGARGAGSRGGAWGSLFSAQEFAAVTGVGFDPVGHVFGTAVVHLGYVNSASRCSGTWSYTPRTDLASAAGGPFRMLLRKRYGVRRLALSRAVERCAQLGGDGIVGVTLTIRPFPAGGTEFTVQGTAVRARSATRPAAPFTSHLSAQQFAALLRAGWVPTALVFGISLASRHDDRVTRGQTLRWSVADREVRGYSELVKDARRDARAQLERAVADQGADGVVVDAMTLHVGERECPTVEGQHDHLAEAAILGTSIVSFERSPRAGGRAPLTIMYLGSSASSPTSSPASSPPSVSSRAPGGLRPVEAPPALSEPAAEGGLLDRFTSKRTARRVARSPISVSDPTSVSRKAGVEHNEEK